MNQINKHIIEKLVSWIECLCCVPITIYGLCYKQYEPIMDIPIIVPIIETIVDHYI